MPNEFVARNGIIALNNSIVTGSLNVTAGITGSLFGTSSHAVTASFFGGSISTAVSASYASSSTSASYASSSTSASYALNAGNTQTASFATNANSASYALNAGNAQTASFATNAANAFIQNGNSFGAAALLGTNDAQNLQFETNGTVRMTISGSGPIGIGTATPTLALLQVQGNVSASSYSGSLLGTASFAVSASWAPAGVAAPGISSYIATGSVSASLDTTPTQIFRLISGSSVFMQVSSSGNVGFGLTAPIARFHVAGPNQGPLASGVARLGFADSSSVAIFTNADPLYGTLFGTLSTGVGWIQQQRINGVATAYDLLLQPNVSGATGGVFEVDGAAAGANAFYVSASGNVGIGTNAPVHELHIQGVSTGSTTVTNINQFSGIRLDGSISNTSRVGIAYQSGGGGGATVMFGRGSGFDTNISFYTNTSAVAGAMTERAVIDSNGNLGLGATSPAAKFEIKSSAANNLGGLLLRATSTSNFPAILYENSTNGGTLDLYNNAALAARISANGDSYISSSGNFGLGTATPATKLHIIGNISASALYINNAAGTYFSSDGNGTTFTGTGYFYANQSGLFYIQSSIVARGGIQNDGATFLTLNGGTSNHTYINGNLGVSITTPTARLHISGSTNSMLRIESQDVSDTNPTVYIEGNKANGAPYTATLIELRSNNDARGRGIHMTISGSNTRWFAGVPYQGSGYQIGYDASANGLPYVWQSASLFVSSNGSVGLGTFSPGARLEVNGRIRLSSNGSTEIYSSGDRILFRGESADNVGQFASYGIFLPVTSQAFNLYLAGSAQLGYSDTTAALSICRGSSGATSFIYLTSNGNSFLNGGNVGIGTTGPAYRLDVSGSARVTASLAVGNVAPSATIGRIDATNDIVAFSTSDIRFKTNVTPISNALDKITQIGGYEFDWIPNQEHHGFEGHDVGVIAQEIEKVLPEVIKERDSGYKAVKYEKIVPLLIEAIKEQQKQIDDLQKQINHLVENR